MGDDDLLSAFNYASALQRTPSAEKPQNVTQKNGTQRFTGSRAIQSPAGSNNMLGDDDDPFGLSQMQQSKQPSNTQAMDEDDILGDLSKPISEVASRKQAETTRTAQSSSRRRQSIHDKALAELMDMGFPLERAQYALGQTESGNDVQVAVSVLLNEAHSASSNKPKPQPTQERRRPEGTNQKRRESETPPWLNGTSRSQSTKDVNAVGGEDKELTQYATEIGNSMWKSANTLWKTGQKKVAKAVADLQQEGGDSSQPRWMREAQGEQLGQDLPKGKSKAGATDVTNEVAMLASGKQKPASRPTTQQRRISDLRAHSSPATRRDRPPPVSKTSDQRPQSRPQSARADASIKPTQRLNRQAIEDETAQAYISPARRKKQQQAQAPSQPKAPEETLDIFSSEVTPPPSRLSQTSSAPPLSSRLPSRPKQQPVVPRKAPSVPSTIVETSHRHRKAGTEAFKRGDYVAAHSSYSTALNGLPGPHPLTIVIRSNRAITSIKSGDAKSALIDAEAALQTIGPSNGEGESVSLSSEEGDKPMRDFYGKALMRKAEAFEHMEKFSDAAKAWRDAVQAGIGGTIAIQGRNRCEKASGRGDDSRAKSTPPKPISKPVAKSSAMRDLGGPAPGEAEAVKRLRAAEAAAVAASDEAFALTDAVEARIANWKGGKADNLRALLGSLDTILWVDAGWNKVGMSDLVLPQRVKIIYMKAIAKVHPDKVSIYKPTGKSSRVTNVDYRFRRTRRLSRK